MASLERWEEAQQAEVSYWAGFTKAEVPLMEALASYAAQASHLLGLLQAGPETCLEIGVGPLGVGISGFLLDIPSRLGLDPLAQMRPQCTDSLQTFIDSHRVPCVVGRGESLPVGNDTTDLVVCSNVLDHVQNAGAVLAEIRRVLTPGGHLFLEVDTFSLLGLLKWYGWTKYKHRNEILVKAHPYRFLERTVHAMLEAEGFKLLAQDGHSLIGLILGPARKTTFFAVKR